MPEGVLQGGRHVREHARVQQVGGGGGGEGGWGRSVGGAGRPQAGREGVGGPGAPGGHRGRAGRGLHGTGDPGVGEGGRPGKHFQLHILYFVLRPLFLYFVLRSIFGRICHARPQYTGEVMTREELDSRLETALPGRYSPTLVHQLLQGVFLTGHTKNLEYGFFFL